MICAYDEFYLDHARKVLAVMMDYAINTLEFPPDQWYLFFSCSPLARQFEAGNPKYLAGMSGVELAHTVLTQVGLETEPKDYRSIDRTPEYWMGWALGYYQWLHNIRFSEILQKASIDDILRMYKKYHETDIRRFCEALDQRGRADSGEANLKRLRLLAGYSQKTLALKSGVPVRTIQQYEQGQKNINHAQVEAVLALAQALGCQCRDILETHE